ALLGSRAMSLWSERIMAVLPDGHPLAVSETLHWTDLQNETVLLSQCDPGPELQDLLVAKLASPGIRLKIARQDLSCGSIKSLVAAGFGVTLMTEASLGA